MTDHIDVNLRNWEERAAIHARDVAGGYRLDRFRAGEDSLHEIEAVSAVGGTPVIRAANGGLDANWMVRHRVPTVTFGAGQNEAHTIDEWINLDEYDRACALAIKLATMR